MRALWFGNIRFLSSGHFRLKFVVFGTFARKLRLSNFRVRSLGKLAREFSLGILTWELPLGNFRLGTFAWKLPPEIFLGSVGLGPEARGIGPPSLGASRVEPGSTRKTQRDRACSQRVRTPSKRA